MQSRSIVQLILDLLRELLGLDTIFYGFALSGTLHVEEQLLDEGRHILQMLVSHQNSLGDVFAHFGNVLDQAHLSAFDDRVKDFDEEALIELRNDASLELLDRDLALLAFEFLNHRLWVLKNLVLLKLKVVKKQVAKEGHVDSGKILRAESIPLAIVVLDDLDFRLRILKAGLKQSWLILLVSELIDILKHLTHKFLLEHIRHAHENLLEVVTVIEVDNATVFRIAIHAIVIKLLIIGALLRVLIWLQSVFRALSSHERVLLGVAVP